ncbi:MAG: acetyl/propionyl/methylcrotonyl-CoA carboxylase subunit alpha [Azospirillaceae bacterium]
MFDTILIANRGEIACRVIGTARAMGIRSVAVYSEADRDARHVRLADEALCLGPAAARESYLAIDRVIAAARAAGAQAIHPGYGFLSENASFAEACAEAGITFIGPPAAAIRAMGGKSEAKALMAEAGVPFVPGYHGADQSDDILLEEARTVGFPVLIKASAGGGGKGMRVVERAEDFAEALAGARREAAASFGDDRVLIEKYLTRPRHIEVQVFADTRGQAIHLFERDCSIQRRHQKVVEEAPAPGMTAQLRQRMGEAAVAAAKAIGYVGAGTVEFLLDEDGAFYFMEMNTRLQVEHPVTELITGTDLVEWQLRVASGEPLPLSQEAVGITGHAVEVRLYAEDPEAGFLPATGTLQTARFPDRLAHVRVDRGVDEGDRISVHYDPMIAKIIAWGADRPAAIRTLRRAVAETAIAGLVTNLAFLARVVGHPGFAPVDGPPDLDTRFIERYREALLPPPAPPAPDLVAGAALSLIAGRSPVGADGSPWAALTGWRLNGSHRETIRLKTADAIAEVVVDHLPGRRLGLAIGDWRMVCEMPSRADLVTEARTDSGVHRWRVARHGLRLTVFDGAEAHGFDHLDPVSLADLDSTAEGALTAPMPGRVISVLVAEGAEVAAGQALLVLEAMKMEHTIRAPGPGTVERLPFKAGEQVEEGVELAIIKPPA